VWVCGNNFFDQLGLKTVNSSGYETRNIETDVFQLRELSSLRDERVIEVISKGLFTMFLTSNHKVWGCGHNEFFQLGLGHTQKVQLPVNISAANPNDFGKKEIIQVECGYDHTLFLTRDNEVFLSARFQIFLFQN
jgi:alpha-tubulin suppressor-like RCC1 family protein